jgi:hypothetical protein
MDGGKEKGDGAGQANVRGGVMESGARLMTMPCKFVMWLKP